MLLVACSGGIKKFRHLLKNINPLHLVFFGLAACWFLIGLFSSIYAPGFPGKNIISGIEFWKDKDPGTWYLQSAHEILRKPPVFNGHPGIPMQIVNALVQKVIYFFSHGDNESYTACIVRNIYAVQMFSRFLILLMWIASAWMVRLLTEKLFKNNEAGYLAAILFLTSFPVLFFLNRISPEPYMIFFFLSAFYCLVLAREYGNAGKWKQAIGLSCVSVSAAVAAFYSKINLFAPFPVFIFIIVAIFMFRPLRWKYFGTLLLLSLSSALVTVICFEPFMDWQSFFQHWVHVEPGVNVTNTGGNQVFFDAALKEAKQIGSVFRLISFQDLLPFTDKSRMFFATETGLILVYFCSFFYRAIRKNKVLMTMNGYAIFPTYIFLYRATVLHDYSGFHYLFPWLAVCCIHAGYLVQVITCTPALAIPRKYTAASLLMVLIIHFTSLVYGVNAHRIRIKQGQEARQVYQALATLKPGEALPAKWRNTLWMLGITTGNKWNLGVPSLMENEVLRLQQQEK